MINEAEFGHYTVMGVNDERVELLESELEREFTQQDPKVSQTNIKNTKNLII